MGPSVAVKPDDVGNDDSGRSLSRTGGGGHERESMPDKQTYLESLGIAVSDVGTPYFRPDGRPRVVTLMGARKPSPQELTKQLPEGRGELTILAIFDIEVAGVMHRWEVSSKRLLAALKVAVTGLPIVLEVSSHGSGMATTFTVRKPERTVAQLMADKKASKTAAHAGDTAPAVEDNNDERNQDATPAGV